MESGDVVLVFHARSISPAELHEIEHAPFGLDAVGIVAYGYVVAGVLCRHVNLGAGNRSEKRFRSFSDESTGENNHNNASAVINGEFLNDKLAALELCLDDGTSLSVL